jgi:hypothetical protein
MDNHGSFSRSRDRENHVRLRRITLALLATAAVTGLTVTTPAPATAEEAAAISCTNAVPWGWEAVGTYDSCAWCRVAGATLQSQDGWFAAGASPVAPSPSIGGETIKVGSPDKREKATRRFTPSDL